MLGSKVSDGMVQISKVKPGETNKIDWIDTRQGANISSPPEFGYISCHHFSHSMFNDY